MTITFVGAGSSSTGNNAAVTTTYHASTADGDTVILHASIRNSGTGVPVLPTGWTLLALFGNEMLAARTWRTGDPTAQQVTFSGGAAGDDTIVHSGTFRGVWIVQTQTASTQLNASAQDIAFPALTAPLQAGSLVILAGWKQGTGTTAISTPAGFTGVTSVFSVAGNGAAATMRYQIQTTPASVSSGTLTVTGGAAGISRAMLVALSPVQVTVTPQAVWPPRNLISVTNIAIGDSVTISRIVGSNRTLVQGGPTTATDVSVLRVDAELPFGVPVSYVATVNNLDYITTPVVYTLPGGKVALTDAITGLAAEVIIWAWSDMEYTRLSTVFKPGSRNVVVSGPFGQPESEVELYFDATSSIETLVNLLAGATQGIIQIRQPGGYDRVDRFVAVTSVTERRYSQDGSDQKRIIKLHVVNVDGWAPTLLASGFTYQNLADTYVGLTYANVAADYATYLLLAQGNFS